MSQIVVAYNERSQTLTLKALEFSTTSKSTIHRDREITLIEFRSFINSLQAFFTTVQSQQALLENVKVNGIAKASSTTLSNRALGERETLYDRSSSLLEVACQANTNIMSLRRKATALEDDIKRLRADVDNTCDDFALKSEQLELLEVQAKTKIFKAGTELQELNRKVSTLAVDQNETHEARNGVRYVCECNLCGLHRFH